MKRDREIADWIDSPDRGLADLRDKLIALKNAVMRCEERV